VGRNGVLVPGHLVDVRGQLRGSGRRDRELDSRAFACANSIFWGNVAPTGSQIALLAGSAQQHAVIASCDVEGGQAGIFVASGTLTYGTGNLALDPRFAGSYELSRTSPCIDAGDDTAVLQDRFDIDGDGNTTEPVPRDLGLRSRFLDEPTVPDTGVGPAPIVDMGAFEFRILARAKPAASHP